MGVAWVASSDEQSGRRPVAAQIEREFSGVKAWYGRATGAWWAVVRVRRRGVWGVRLVEAADPQALREEITATRGRPWPR